MRYYKIPGLEGKEYNVESYDTDPLRVAVITEECVETLKKYMETKRGTVWTPEVRKVAKFIRFFMANESKIIYNEELQAWGFSGGRVTRYINEYTDESMVPVVVIKDEAKWEKNFVRQYTIMSLIWKNKSEISDEDVVAEEVFDVEV